MGSRAAPGAGRPVPHGAGGDAPETREAPGGRRRCGGEREPGKALAGELSRPPPPQRRGPYLARGPARSPSSAGRRWSRSPGWRPRPRSSPATRRRGRGSALPPRPLPHRPPSASSRRELLARRLPGPSAPGSGSAPGPGPALRRAARPAPAGAAPGGHRRQPRLLAPVPRGDGSRMTSWHCSLSAALTSRLCATLLRAGTARGEAAAAGELPCGPQGRCGRLAAFWGEGAGVPGVGKHGPEDAVPAGRSWERPWARACRRMCRGMREGRGMRGDRKAWEGVQGCGKMCRRTWSAGQREPRWARVSAVGVALLPSALAFPLAFLKFVLAPQSGREHSALQQQGRGELKARWGLKVATAAPLVTWSCGSIHCSTSWVNVLGREGKSASEHVATDWESLATAKGCADCLKTVGSISLWFHPQ